MRKYWSHKKKFLIWVPKTETKNLNLRPQFVDNLLIVRLRLSISMRRAVIIINYFLVQKVEVKICYYLLLKFCLGLTKSPWHNLSQNSTELRTKLMRTIVLIQNIDHSFIVVSRKYTNLNLTHFFSTNPCFPKNTVYVSGDTLTHPQKTWICRKTCV